MNKKLLILLIAAGLLLFCINFAFARGVFEREQIDDLEQAVIQVTGVVRLVGSDPFYELVISSSDGEWYIAAEEKQNFHNLQQKTVTLEAEETVTEMTSANNRFSMIRRELRNVKLLQVSSD